MNKNLGDAVKAALKRKGMTQQQLADVLEMKPTNLSTMLAGRGSDIPKRWQDILDAVGLELTAKDKGQS